MYFLVFVSLFRCQHNQLPEKTDSSCYVSCGMLNSAHSLGVIVKHYCAEYTSVCE